MDGHIRVYDDAIDYNSKYVHYDEGGTANDQDQWSGSEMMVMAG